MDETDHTQENQPEQLECTINIEDSGAWKKKISVQIARDQIDKELDKQYGDLRRTSEVPGFRKGRAPRRLIEKRFGEDVSDQTKLRLLAAAFERIEKENDFEILGEPDLEIEEIELPKTGDLSFDYEVEIKPEFELPALEGVKLEKRFVAVTDERVDEALMELRNRYGTWEDVTDGAEKDDLVTADVSLQFEGAEEPKELNDYTLRVGPAGVGGVMVEDMAEVLQGAKPGDTKTCSAEVPDTYPEEECRGKKVAISIEVKTVQRRIPAEMNEKFFAMFATDSEAEIRMFIEEQLEDQIDRESRQMMVQQVNQYLQDNIDFELPAGVAARHANRYLARRYYDLLNQGVPQEQIQENMEQFRAASSEQAGRELKMSFIMERVADSLDINVTEGEINGFIAQAAIRMGRRPEKLRDEIQRENRLEAIQEDIRAEKAVDRILEMAEVVDAPAVEDSEDTETKPKTSKSEKVDKTEKKPVNKAKKETSQNKVEPKPPASDK